MNLELGTSGGQLPPRHGATRRRARGNATDVTLAGAAIIIVAALLTAAWPAPPPSRDPDLAVVVAPTDGPDSEAIPAPAKPTDTRPKPDIPEPADTTSPEEPPGISEPAEATEVADRADMPDGVDPADPDGALDVQEPLDAADAASDLSPVSRGPLVFRAPAMLTDAPGMDPVDLPRFPGSRRIAYVEGQAGPVVSARMEYLVSATPDAVRAYYREAMRAHGWFVGEIDVAEGAWRFDANRGTREVTLGILPTAGVNDPATRVSLSVSDVVPQATATPTPTPRATPKRTRPRTEAIRPRERVRITPRVTRRDDQDDRRRPGRRGDDADDDDGDDRDGDSRDDDT